MRTRRTCWTEAAAGSVRKQPHREETPGKNTVEKQSGNNLERVKDRERDVIKALTQKQVYSTWD